MKIFLLSLKTLGAMFLCSATCIAGTVKENRTTEPFRKISVTSGIDVYYTSKDSHGVVVEAEASYIGRIVTETEGETLVVKFKLEPKGKIRNPKMKVYVSAPALDEVTLSGGSDFYADNLKCENSFQLKTSGGSDAKIAALTVAGNADISASGGADAYITDMTVAGNTDIRTSGGADCKIHKLQTADCNLSASAGSDMKIYMELSGNLTVNASGGADMDLSGTANNVSGSASGASDINMRKLSCKAVDIRQSGFSDVDR
jgi:hypothetical protein